MKLITLYFYFFSFYFCDLMGNDNRIVEVNLRFFLFRLMIFMALIFVLLLCGYGGVRWE